MDKIEFAFLRFQRMIHNRDALVKETMELVKREDLTPTQLYRYMKHQHLVTLFRMFGIVEGGKTSRSRMEETLNDLQSYLRRQIRTMTRGAGTTGELNSTSSAHRFSALLWLEMCAEVLEEVEGALK